MFSKKYRTITLATLEKAARGVSGARDVSRSDSAVRCTFLDRDGDIIGIQLVAVGETRARATMAIAIPGNCLITAMIVCNLYNTSPDSHGTFAFAQTVDDGTAVAALETDLSASGGITLNNIRSQLQAFIDRINKFEVVLIEGIRELGPDTEFIKGNFWTNLGAFLGGFLKGYAGSASINA